MPCIYAGTFYLCRALTLCFSDNFIWIFCGAELLPPEALFAKCFNRICLVFKCVTNPNSKRSVLF